MFCLWFLRRSIRRYVGVTLMFLIFTAIYFVIFRMNSLVSTAGRNKLSMTGLFDSGSLDRSQAGQACVHPQLNLWTEDIKKHFLKPRPLQCAQVETNWVHISNGTFYIREEAKKRHGDISCEYIPFKRGNNDFAVINGDIVKPMKEGTAIDSDWFEVKCSGKDGRIYKNIHSAIAYKDSLHQRKMSLPPESLGLNIVIFGFDSVSRMNWIRNLPKSHNYFVEKLGGVVLEGYNIVGDGTPQALLPILTGKTEPELPEARRGHAGSATVDGHPWIWNDLRKQGYVTQWGEDSSSVGTFTYRMLGFKNQPVDHYLRPFYIRAEREYGKHKPNCLGSVARHVNMLNWIRELFAMYPRTPKFSFLFHSEYSHGAFSDLQVADATLNEFLEYMESSGNLNNTLLILMADHGARFQALRKTVQGKYEERMPYFALRVPPWFREKYPDAYGNLKTNSRRLTTPFDIHATFHHLMNFTNPSQRVDLAARGISLFKQIPQERTCHHADVELHWCACLSWEDVSTNDVKVQRAGKALLESINKMTEEFRNVCTELTIKNISNSVKFEPPVNVLKFKNSKDNDGRVADLSDDMKVTEIFYQITMTTQPGLGQFEATVKYLPVNDVFVANVREISRINKYGLQPHCVMKSFPHLRPYCMCKEQVATA